MRASRTWKRTVAGFLAAGLVIAACGDDDDDAAEPADTGAEATEDTGDAAEDESVAEEDAADEAPEETTADTDEAMTEDTTEGTDAAAGGEPLPTEGEVEVAAGTVLNLDECPDDWSATTGVEGDEIRLGMTLAQSGQLAAFGAIGEGMQAYFDFLNENDPIDDKELVLVTRDDAYEAGRAVANVEEMLDTEDIFSFVHFIGTPINAATRPITDEECVPQLFNSSGFPLWGDPANWPWTIGFILDYNTEADIWCQSIVDEFGEGATVAALYMNNDFGQTYQARMQECEGIDLVEEQLHDPAAPDVTNEMTTLVATDADVFIAGTTAAFCPQSVGSVAASEWRPRFYMSYTCNQLASFFEPVKDAAGALAADGAGVRMANSNKVCGDPRFDDDPVIVEAREILDEAGFSCEDGSFFVGIIYGEIVEETVRAAAELPGGLNRVNLMSAVWNLDTTSEWLLSEDGTIRTDGVNDAYITESAQVQEVVVEDGTLAFSPVGDVIDLEGEGGSFEGG